MDGVLNLLDTQSMYQQVLGSPEMEALRDCSQLHNGNVDIEPSQLPEGSRQTNDLELRERHQLLDQLEAEAEAEAEAPDNEIEGDILLEFPSSINDPGFVDESTNQLVLSHSSDIEPRPIRDQNIIFTSYNWSTLCTRYLAQTEVHAILSVHAYNLFNIPKLVAGPVNRALAKNKYYHCSCSKFRIRVNRIDDGATGDDRKWKIDPNYMQPGEAVVGGGCSYLYQPKKKIPYHEAKCHCVHSNIKLKQTVVANIPIIQTWIEEDLHPLKKATTFNDMIKKAAQQGISFNFVNSPSQWTVIKQAVQDSIYLKSSKMYHHLPAFVNALTATNPNVSAALQNDSEGRFCRFWIGLPIAKQHGVFTQPIYVVDCFHSKCTMYGGVIMAFSSRTGFGRTVVEAAAWLPNESTPHLAWVVQMCKRHGMGLEDAIFTDQGPFLAAINALNTKFLLPFYVMLCLQHIFRNAYSTFGPLFKHKESKEEFTSMMNAASFCEDQATFFETIFHYLHNKLDACAKGLRHLYIALVLYVFRLQPALWSVFANAPLFKYDDYWKYMKDAVLPYLFSSLYINLNYKEEHREFAKCCELIIESRARAAEMTDAFLATYEKAIFRTKGPCPRYFNTRTNIAESFAMTALSSGFRYEIPPVAIKMFISVYNKQIKLLESDLSIMKTSMLTTTGSRIKTAIARQNVVFVPQQTTFPDIGKYFKSIIDRTPSCLDDNDNNANNSFAAPGDDEHRESDRAKLLVLTPSSQCGSDCDQSQSQLDRVTPQDEEWNDDDEDCDFSQNEEYERSMDIANQDNDDSSVSVIERVTVEGRFTSVGGFAYKATLSWLHSTHGYVYDPVFEHSCHGCVHFSGMVQFPCFCILAVAEHSYKHDKRWPKEHPLIHGILPASFYPKCFRSEENYHNFTREKLIIDLPTQEVINGFSSPPQVKPPPQYKGTVESGLRIASTGEDVSKGARVAKVAKNKKGKKTGKETSARRTNTNFASEWSRMAKVNAASPELASSLFGDDEQFVPSSQQSKKIESTTNIRLTKEYHCSHCNSTNHTYPKCPRKAAAGAGVVKPKDIIVTGNYVVYTVRKHPSVYTDNNKPIEIAALSSNQINNRTFRRYNPDGNDESELSLSTKLFGKDGGSTMNFKDLKKYFTRTNPDRFLGKNVYKLNITDKNSMFGHVMSFNHDNLGHYTTEEADIDCWEVADSQHCLKFESQLDNNYKPPAVCQNIPQQMHLGSPSSLSPTESCILQKLDAVKDDAFDLINTFLEQNARNSNDQPAVLSHLLLKRLIAEDGFQKTSELVSRQAAIRLSQALIATPTTDQSGTCPYSSQSIRDFFSTDAIASQYLTSQRSNVLTSSNLLSSPDAADVDDICGIFKISNEGAILDLCDDSEDSDDADSSNPAPSNIQLFMERDKETLNDGVWLNDEVVSLFFSVLQNAVNNQQKVYFLNSFFMTKMFVGGKRYNYDLVKSWGGELDLSNADTIYVPININRTHWILGIIQPHMKLIEICDSGKFETEQLYAGKYGNVLLLFMEDRAKSRSVAFEKSSWSIVEKECPQQLNLVDCGVFMLIYAVFHSRKLNIVYNQEYINHRRPEILLSIMDKQCHIELDVPANFRLHHPSHIIKDKTIPLIDLTAINQISRCTEVFVSKKKKNNNNNKKGKEKENSEEPSNLEELSSANAATAKSAKAATSKELEEELSLMNGLGASPGAETTANEQLHQKLPPTYLVELSSSKAAPETTAKEQLHQELKEDLSITSGLRASTTTKEELDQKLPPAVTTQKKRKMDGTLKRNRTHMSHNATSSLHSTSSSDSESYTGYSSPDDPDDPDQVKKKKVIVDIFINDFIKVQYDGHGGNWSPEFKILSIKGNKIDLDLPLPMTTNANVSLYSSTRADVDTSHFNRIRRLKPSLDGSLVGLRLHDGSVDGIYIEERCRNRNRKTRDGVLNIFQRVYVEGENEGENFVTAAAAATPEPSHLIKIQTPPKTLTPPIMKFYNTSLTKEFSQEISSSRQLFPNSPSTTAQAHTVRRYTTTHLSTDKMYYYERACGKKVCHACREPYIEFKEDHAGVHAIVCLREDRSIGLVWCTSCYQESLSNDRANSRKRRLPFRFRC